MAIRVRFSQTPQLYVQDPEREARLAWLSFPPGWRKLLKRCVQRSEEVVGVIASGKAVAVTPGNVIYTQDLQ